MRRVPLYVGLVLLIAAGLWWFLLAPAPDVSQAVVLDDSGALVLVDLHGSQTLLRAAPARGEIYQVTPQQAGVAYVVREPAEAQIEYLAFDALEPVVLHTDSKVVPFYLAWSPDGRWLTFLATDVFMELYLVPVDGSAKPLRIKVGQPSYFAWAPDSSRLLLHIGGAAPQGQLFEYEVASDTLTTLDQAPGLFQRPDWRNNQDVLVVTQAGVQNSLTFLAAEEALLAPSNDMFVFNFAPQRDLLAYITINSSGRSPIHVLDLESDTTEVLAVPYPLAFFWSPDGTKIAALVPSTTPGLDANTGIVRVAAPLQQSNSVQQVTWFVADLQTATVQQFQPWTPNNEFINVLPYFDQYASSLHIWSPDSANVIYSTSEGVQSLAISDGTITSLSKGNQGFWRPQDH